MRSIKVVGVLLGVGVAACTVSGAPTEQVGQVKDELASSIVVSDAVPAEDPVYNSEPAGWYTVASSPKSHLIVTQSPAPVLGGYGAVASSFVVRAS